MKIARLANRTLEQMHALGSSTRELLEASEVRRLRDVIAFHDMASFQHAQESFRLYEQFVPEDRGTTEVLSGKDAMTVRAYL